MFTERLGGVKHFGLWPLSETAETCFGTDAWPPEVPVPQVSVEFEVADVALAAAELERAGYRLIHGAKTEPWGQVTEPGSSLRPAGRRLGADPFRRTGPMPST